MVLGHGVTLGGHVEIGDRARVGAFIGVHQFCRIGAHSMIGGYSVITQDVMPFADRKPKSASENLRRQFRRGWNGAAFAPEQIEAMNKAFRLLRSEALQYDAIERDSRRDRRMRRDRSTRRVHRALRARIHQVKQARHEALRADRGQRALPDSRAEEARTLGDEVVVIGMEDEASREIEQLAPRRCTGSRSPN